MNYKCVEKTDPDLIRLIALLDDEYVERFGEIALQYRKYNTLEEISRAFLIYDGQSPIACGCIKVFDETTVEIKRVFVCKKYRRQHVATKIVEQCEEEAKKQGFRKAVLETGADMPEAIALYKGLGYELVDNYGPFEGDSVCVCMSKEL